VNGHHLPDEVPRRGPDYLRQSARLVNSPRFNAARYHDLPAEGGIRCRKLSNRFSSGQ